MTRITYEQNVDNVQYDQKRSIILEGGKKGKEPVLPEESEYSDIETSDDFEEEEENENSPTFFMQEFDKKNMDNIKFVPKVAEFIVSNLMKEEQEYSIDVSNFDKVQTKVTKNMRKIVVKWLINLHRELRTKSSTLYNCVYYFDSVLSKHDIAKDKLQLLGAICLWEASKLEEFRVFSYKEISYYCNENYTIEDFEEYERLIIATMNFKMEYPNQKQFLKRFLSGINPSRELTEVCLFLCECSLLDYEYHRFLSSKIAFTIVLIGSFALNMTISLPILMSYAHMPDLDDLLACSNCIIESAKEVLESKKGSIYQKFTSSDKTGVVLKLEFGENVYKNIKFLDNVSKKH